MPNNLTGTNISDTYQRLLQISSSGQITDGTGSIILIPSASYAISASHEITYELSSSYAETASMASSNFIIQGHLTASGAISASGIITGEGLVISDDATITDDLTVNGDILLGQNNKLANASQTTTHIQFLGSSIGQMLFDCAGIEMMRMTSNSGVVFNAGGSGPADFRVEGNTDQYLVFADSGADKVAIGTNTVGNSLLTVDGDLTATRLTASVAISASVINGAGTGTAQLNVAGQITASSNISSSGTIIGLSGSFTHLTNVNTTHVTASGNISSSGDIIGHNLKLFGLSDATETSALMINSSKVVSTRTLGSNAFTATTIGTTTNSLTDGTGIADFTFNGSGAATIATDDSAIVHDDLSGFVDSEHINHTDVSITAGAGLTGGGTIASTRDIAVGAGTGVTVNANDVAIGQDVATTANVEFNHITGSIISSSKTVTARNFEYPTTHNTTVGSSTGDIITWGTATATTAGQIYYYNTSGAWAVADADALGSAYSILAVATDDNSSKGMLLRGVTTLHTITGTQDEGVPLYLKASADGHVNIDAPSTSGHIVRIIGYCLDTSKRVWFDPDKTWVELS